MTPHKSYKVGRAGVILSVFDEPEMVYMINCGKVLKTDDYWTEGMPGRRFPQRLAGKSRGRLQHLTQKKRVKLLVRFQILIAVRALRTEES